MPARASEAAGLPQTDERAVADDDVIEHGDSENFTRLNEALREHTNYVDLVVSTHPDNDHSGGLQTLMNRMQVGQIWMHKPWEHTQGMSGVFKDGRVTDMSLKEALRKSLDSALEIERIARRNYIQITEPFTGVSYGDAVYVVGPSRVYYDSLLPDFRSTSPAAYTSIFKRLAEATGDMVATVAGIGTSRRWATTARRPPKTTRASSWS